MIGWPDTVYVYCEVCGVEVEVGTVELAAGGITIDEEGLEALGWEDETCPACAAQEAGDD